MLVVLMVLVVLVVLLVLVGIQDQPVTPGQPVILVLLVLLDQKVMLVIMVPMVLREMLVKSLRERTLSLENEDLRAHLRTTVVNQIAIDQPNYSGLKTAIKARSA